ncbi:MAG: endolytic transglycosylase MltG [Pseudomonadota bacterium]
MRNIAANTLSILIVLGLVLLAVIGLARQEISAPGPSTDAVNLTVAKGAKLDAVAGTLEKAGAIENEVLFKLAARYSGKDRELKYGEYEIPAGSSMEEILDLLASGGNVFYRVTIPEGMTTHFALERINDAELLTGEITEIPAEGALLPDTYTYERGSARAAMVAQMEAAMDKFLDEAWANRAPDLPLNSKEELLILASIIEKETRPQEHGKVASVFINRLNRGMKLQTDPTVIYGITDGKSVLGRGLRRSELNRATPYNTYVIEGLPPGPIANPGRESILAAANPETTPYLFFVADGTGGHAFAETLAEHNKNVAVWRRIERERRANQ